MRPAASRCRATGFLTAAVLCAAVLGGCGSSNSAAKPTTTTAKAAAAAPSNPAEAERVSVPSVNKLPYAEARKKLEDAGFKVVVPADIADTDVIGGTAPSAGAFIPKGSSVELRVDPTANKKPSSSAKSPAKSPPKKSAR